MKSRGPNVSVLHLRSTSEPWTIAETEEDKLIFNNVNSNFGMDYENFFKNYERNNQFLTNCRDDSCSIVTAANTYLPLNSIRRSSTISDINPSTRQKCLNTQRMSSNIENGDIMKNNTRRNNLHNLMKSPSFHSEYSDKYFTNRKGRESDIKSYSNYPIISPPPGFQDESLLNGNHVFSDTSPENEKSILLSRLGKFSLDEKSIRNQNLPSQTKLNEYEQNGRKFKVPYHKSNFEDFKTVAYPSNLRRNQLIDGYNYISGHPYEQSEHSFLDSEQRPSRSTKSCSEYTAKENSITHCQWCHSAVIPKRSYSAGNAQYYFECSCHHCGAVLPSVSFLNGSTDSDQRNHIIFTDEKQIRSRQKCLPEQNRICRSASFQSGYTNPQFSMNGFSGSRNAVNWTSNARVNRKPVHMTFKNEYDELHIGSVGPVQHYNGLNYCNSSCVDDDDDDYEDVDDELFYEVDNENLGKCTCSPTKKVNGTNGYPEPLPLSRNEPLKSRTFSNRYKECYPATHTDITEILNLNPPDIANVKSTMDFESHYNHINNDVEFIRKQPDILQSAYYGKKTPSICSETPAKNYMYSNSIGYMSPRSITEHRKKACSLPKSFQGREELEKFNSNATLFYHWKKYGFRGLFLNRKTSYPNSIMSETAPSTPVKDMPEKKKYGRLMKVGQYSSSPALDDDHVNFDCDTRYKRDKFKMSNPASNVCDFRPASQENIVSADGVFHKFCKSFSLRFLRKACEHEAGGIPKNENSSPCTEKLTYVDNIQVEKPSSLPCRSNSERSRRVNISNNKLKSYSHVSSNPTAEEKDSTQKVENPQYIVRRTLSDLNQYSTGVNDEVVNPTVPGKYKTPVPVMARKYKQCSLRRSASQPLINGKNSPTIQKKSPPCRTACSEDERALFSEDDMMSDSGGSSLPSRKNSFEKGINEDAVIFAEAVWDHVAIESEELPFKAGDVIEVYNVLDRDWWWGMCNGKSGWFPSDFVRLRVNQEESLQSHFSESTSKQNTSISSMTNDQMRSKIICELLNTERDFVKILNDVQEAFVSACQESSNLFTNEQIYKIFGNWDQIMSFQTMFLENIEANFNEQNPHETCVGDCFLKFRDHFCIYSDYCNNHPLSIATLQQLYEKDEYKSFFENCRLKKNLIAISLDGFLLTPIQRICKYPLQLAELLKHTESDHNDHLAVEDALNAMREVAVLINERKRRMESLEKLILWQQRVDGWDGNNLIEDSSQLIHQNDVTKVFAGIWTTNVTLFLFDHQLVFCKKDILKRDFYVYKGRISLDGCEIIDVPDGKDTILGINIRNGVRIQNMEKNKWLLFCCRTQREKQEWINAFCKEKELVLTDERNKLQITPMDRQLAYITATTCNNRHAFLKHKNKKLKRPINHPGHIRNANSPHILGKKVGTWFMFGANRKNHRRYVSKNHTMTS